MSLTVGLWVSAGFILCAIASGVAIGVGIDAVLTLRDLSRSGQKYVETPGG